MARSIFDPLIPDPDLDGATIHHGAGNCIEGDANNVTIATGGDDAGNVVNNQLHLGDCDPGDPDTAISDGSGHDPGC